ncbi:DNA (cytosine-5-)-methyltransferase [Campylobacter jejuni]|uniref:Cytosine-specific methyltransferase n=3 Tax=Campylobacter jejuni TaxID=197 RepID=A0A1J6PVR6_CAMJU|nr:MULTISPECIES: DNA (cytosine-5-)-methyltransferase [Campylobacter]ASE86750.1 DNA (cytosine-5-)-methyltransferase [Campylobacter jejuni]AVS39331.1 DNA (cytosine-5-)-methyltransferase [Campylobacter coli]AZU50800.1 DNA (cytosine-5-)-methyltransferase [Campylobacter jejuni subsp. jejuni]EAB5321765.1 DNA (cytosine-5-)-methyltransferase [Campylobacter jejuni]EAH4580607.1 DNA (cytosine-5-)-methyltransferase [Campylobacter jejuni]
MKFIDFCSGIGGGRLGLEKAGFTCIAFSEIDKAAIKTYKRLFDTKNELELGDLTKINPEILPDFDLLISGFPCQSFSIVGKREGLDNKEKGQVIFYLADILKIKQPNFFILENVKGLLNHDKGQTFQKILELLKSLDYEVSTKLLNSLDFSLAQSRERVYFIGIKKSLNKIFKFDFKEKKKPNIKDFLNPNDENILNRNKYETFLRYLQNKYNKNRFCLEELLENDFLILDTRQSDLRCYQDKIPTLRRDRQGILYVYNKNFYILSKIEALKLQGFGKINNLEDKIKNIKQSDILRQCGNAMSVNVIESIAKSLKEQIDE